MIEFKKSKDEFEFRKRLNMIESRGGFIVKYQIYYIEIKCNITKSK